MAYVESRYDETAVSRVEGKKRVVGAYPSTMPPKNLRKGASLYCGPLQTFAKNWDECMEQRDLKVAYATAAKARALATRSTRTR